MPAFRHLFFPAIFAIAGFGFTAVEHQQQYRRVTGIVVDSISNKPIPAAHVYLIHGEEEALTNARGEFSIATYSSLPATITAEHEGYKRYISQIQKTDVNTIIRLQSK